MTVYRSIDRVYLVMSACQRKYTNENDQWEAQDVDHR